MANTDDKRSFRLKSYNDALVITRKVDASYAGEPGDVVFLDSAGRATDTASGVILGLQMSAIQDVSSPGDTVDTGAEDDLIEVCADPMCTFEGQITTGALTDAYTTRSSAACFDVAGSAGQQYIDAAASTNDHVKVVGESNEYDGEPSEVGAYQKKLFKFNLAAHYLGTIA